MGYTAYCSTRSADTAAVYSTKSATQIFTNTQAPREMKSKGITLREARDSEAHPNSVPIIIALDVTGSMGMIPEALVKRGLPKIMGNIIQNGVPDPQIMFLAIGDHTCDNDPLQVGQFESGDELLNKWLTSMYLEGGGGGNAGESYLLAWLAAAEFCKTDHYEKRGKKGVLFTIGDEPTLMSLSSQDQYNLLGNGQYEPQTAQQLLARASEQWDIYHIHVGQTYSGRRPAVRQGWQQLLQDHCIIVEDYEEIPAVIAKIVAETQGDGTSVVINEQPSTPIVPDAGRPPTPDTTPDPWKI